METQLAPQLGHWLTAVENAEATKYLVQGLIPCDSLILLSGAPKVSYKTFLAMSLSLAIATGKDFGPFAVTQAHPVLYIYREGAMIPTAARWKAICKGMNYGDPFSTNNIYFRHRGPFFLDDRNWVRQVRDLTLAIGAKLIVVDTLAKSMKGDENNAQAFGHVIENVETLRSTTGASVLLVHHVRKADAKLSYGDRGTPDIDADLRGSSALAGAYEQHIGIRGYPHLEPTKFGKRWYLIARGKESAEQFYEYNWHADQDSARVEITPIGEELDINPPPKRSNFPEIT